MEHLLPSISLEGVLAVGLQKPWMYADAPDFTELPGFIKSRSGFLAQAALFGLVSPLLSSISVSL